MFTRALVAASALALAGPAAYAAVPPAASSAVSAVTIPATLEAPPAAKTFSVGTLRVQRYGDHGRPLILIPGLEGGPWVWRSAIEHFRGEHVIYALTLAGFDGLPLPKDHTHLMGQAEASLLKLIQTRHLEKPVLIGHSLGGTLSIRFAEEHSNLIGGVVAVDGLPILPGFDHVTPDQRKIFAARMVRGIAGATPQQFDAQVLGFMQHAGVIDQTHVRAYAALNARSHPVAVAEYLREDAAADDRPGLQNIRVPLLEVSPYYAPDFRKLPESSGSAAKSGAAKYFSMSEAQKAAYYQHLLQGDPTAQVISIAPSRHFVMLDQPEKLNAVIAAFLQRL